MYRRLDDEVKGHLGWDKWRLMVRRPAHIALRGVLQKHDADKPDLQIVPSARQCWLDGMSFHSLSGGSLCAFFFVISNGGNDRNNLQNVRVARKENAYLNFCCLEMYALSLRIRTSKRNQKRSLIKFTANILISWAFTASFSIWLKP